MTNQPHDRNRRRALPRSSYAARLAVLAMAMSVAVPLSSYAADAAAGTVSGRVLNASTGMYLSKAQVAVDGTELLALTDDYGYFELREVPAGKAKLTVTYTGLQNVTTDVSVTAGKTANTEIKLSRSRLAGELAKDKDTVALEEFVVSTDRFRNAAEIAINEERFSPTIKNVVSADAFGDIPDGNIGEFVKYIPGVQIGYGYDSTGLNAAASNATSISVRGFGPEMTNITIDGVPVTNASPAQLTRAIGLDMQSINNASRIEVIKVSTPDMPSNSPGGSINLITKSSMEYSKPFVSWKVSMNVNSENFGGDMLQKSPGPANKSTYKALPGAEFTYVIPLNSKMGFAFTGAWSKTFNENHRASSDWNIDLRDVSTNTSYKIDLTPGGGPNIDVKLPAGTINYFTEKDGTRMSLANPGLYRFTAVDTPNMVDRTSGSLKFDWRPNVNHKIAVGASFGLFDTVDAQRRLQFYPNRAYLMDWGPTHSISYPFIAKGTIVNGKALTADFNPASQVAMTVTTRDRNAKSYTGYVDYVYARGPLKIDGNVNASKSRGTYSDMANGHFSELETSISGGQMSFLNIKDGIPGSVQFLDKTGQSIDWTQMANWKAPTIQAKSGLTEGEDSTFNAKLNARYDLDFIPWSWMTMSAKTGVYREEKTVKKWGLGTGYKMDYVGPTLAFNDYLDDGYYNVNPGYNLPPQQWLSTYKLYELWQANPSYFNTDKPQTQSDNYKSWTNQQKKITETSDQYYLMFDGKALRNRLSYVFGVRKEIAKRKGYATKADGQWNYVKAKDGTLYRSAAYPNGIKIDGGDLFATTAAGTAMRAELTGAGISFPTTAIVNNTLDAAKLQNMPFQDMSGKVTGKPTYSASFAYDITKDLTARVSWNRAQAKPDFEAGTLSQNGANTFSIAEAATSGTIPAGTITVANPNLKPWTADSYDVQLAYYTSNGGKIAVGGFLKNTKDFHETISIDSPSPVFDEGVRALQLDPANYEGFRLTTSRNGIGTSKTMGYEIEASQNLGIFGRFGSMFHVFGSFSHHYIKQTNTDLLSAKPTAGSTASGGVSVTVKERFSLLLRALWVEEKYLGQQTTYTVDGVDYIVARYNPSQLNLDVVARYSITKKYSFFFNARNILNTYQDTTRYDKTGILPGYARNIDRKDFGVNMVFGINGSF